MKGRRQKAERRSKMLPPGENDAEHEQDFRSTPEFEDDCD